MGGCSRPHAATAGAGGGYRKNQEAEPLSLTVTLMDEFGGVQVDSQFRLTTAGLHTSFAT